MPKKILFLSPYPADTAGSQRFRYEQYQHFLLEEGYSYDNQSFIDEGTWEILYKDGYTIKKMLGILTGFIRRLFVLGKLHLYDFVFIHREATPVGPPVIEWLIARVWKKKVIYDFDDAIWLSNTSHENSLISRLKFPQKVSSIIGWSYKVSAGNQYLMGYASQYNKKVIYNPTTIDTEARHLPIESPGKSKVIGWTGTHSTLKYLEKLRQPLEQLATTHQFVFLVIADKAPVRSFSNQKFVLWNKKSEIDDLNQIDIGLMPLEDDKWARGKCGFKALQFMALEKPVLVSPVGVNAEMVEPGKHGFHCSGYDTWIDNLQRLMEDNELRKAMGQAGRQKVIEQYSVSSNKRNFLSLFD